MNILVTHYFTDSNRGDAAILEGVVVMLRKVFDIKWLRISTREHQSQRKDEYVTSFYYEAVDKIDSSLHRLFRIPYVLFVTTLYSLLYFVFAKKLSILLTKDLFTLMNEYHTSDSVVLTGGGYITGNNTLHGNTNVILQLHGILIPFLLRKQILLFPQSIGPFGNRFQELLVSHILNLASLIMVREKKSYYTLKKIGVKTRTLRMGDMAFLVESKRSHKIDKFRKKYKGNIIVGLTAKDWFSDKRQEIYERELARFMDWVIVNYNAIIFFIPQSVAKIQKDDDSAVLRKIKKLMKYEKNVYFIQDNLDHKEFRAMYKSLDYLIGTRMHSNIFALDGGVPVIAIEYEYKTRGIMDDLGLSEWVVHINDVTKERLEALFTKLLQNSGSYKELLKVRVPTYKKQLLDSVARELRMFSKNQHKMQMNKQNKITLRKPTIFQFAIGLIVSIFKSFGKRHNTKEPQMVGKYNLVSPVSKSNLFRNYFIGIYKYKNKKVFIKSWRGIARDFEYYELINEYLVSKILYKNLKLNGYIKIPKVIECIAENMSLSIVYEYVDGKPLSDFSLEKQKKTLIEVLKYFNNSTNLIVSKDSRFFSKRTLFYYVSALTFLFLITILSNIRSARIILKGYFDFLRHIDSIRGQKLRIAHRDLVPHNILIKDKYIYLIDCSRANLTYEGYDLAYITINPSLRKIAKDIANAFKYSGNTFLENYILINQANSFGNPTGYKNFYLEELRRRYE